MNLNKTQTRNAGIVLIALGVAAIFNLWWLVPVILVGGAGLMIYRRQKAIGHTGEAVQAALWGLGLAALMLIDFIFPGVLLLGGASLLIRGREAEVEARILTFTGRFGRRRTPAITASSPAMPAHQTPVAQPPQPVTLVDANQPSTGETVRLR